MSPQLDRFGAVEAAEPQHGAPASRHVVVSRVPLEHLAVRVNGGRDVHRSAGRQACKGGAIEVDVELDAAVIRLRVAAATPRLPDPADWRPTFAVLLPPDAIGVRE